MFLNLCLTIKIFMTEYHHLSNRSSYMGIKYHYKIVRGIRSIEFLHFFEVLNACFEVHFFGISLLHIHLKHVRQFLKTEVFVNNAFNPTKAGSFDPISQSGWIPPPPPPDLGRRAPKNYVIWHIRKPCRDK